MDVVLKIQDLSKNFGGVAAVQDFHCEVTKGTIHAVIGPNGAGKTTLFNLITGILKPTKGSIRLNGVELVGLRPNDIAWYGVGRTYQNLRLFKNLTVWENIMVSYKAKDKSGLWGMVTGKRSESETRAEDDFLTSLLVMFGLEVKRDFLAKNLAYGEQKRLEVARALAGNPKLLLLDEPMAGMNPHETNEMILAINKIRSQGIITLLVEHNMRVVMSISDRVTVMDFGKVLAEGTPEEITTNEKVISAYLGEAKC